MGIYKEARNYLNYITGACTLECGELLENAIRRMQVSSLTHQIQVQPFQDQ